VKAETVRVADRANRIMVLETVNISRDFQATQLVLLIINKVKVVVNGSLFCLVYHGGSNFFYVVSMMCFCRNN
jgi:hypothetical protein